MKKIKCKQGTPRWLQLRAGIPTASEFKNLISPTFEIRKWSTEMPNTYLATKLAEKWRGMPAETFSSNAMEQGAIREHQAIPWYEGIYDNPVEKVGFITTDDGLIGASPDGLIAPNRGIECKVPEPPTHTKYLIGGKLPDEYAAQVHGSMYVAGADSWVFMSWRPEFPKLVLLIERDDKKIAILAEALAEFNDRLANGWRKLLELNGGPPPAPPIIEADDDSVTLTQPGTTGEML